MTHLNPASLMGTLDNVNQALLDGQPISQVEKTAVSRWIASRQGLAGGYREMYAPTQQDFAAGIAFFTGEGVTHAGARHYLGQEAARILRILNVADVEVAATYQRAIAWMHDQPEIHQHGTFCCAKCSLAVWRHCAVGDFEKKEAVLTKGLAFLQAQRDGDGKWQRFPYHYTLFTLINLDLELARPELAYTRPVMERYLHSHRPGAYAARRTAIIEQALDRV